MRRIAGGNACSTCIGIVGVMLAGVVFAGELQIDHVTVAGANLQAMRDAFTAATGVATEYGGPHSNHATEMALTSFPDGSYLEFIAIQPNAAAAAVAAQPWARFLKGNAGPCAFAIRALEVRPAGIAVGTPESSGRTRPDGTRLAWETSTLGTGARGTFLPFLIRDLTPREKRAWPSGHATTDRFRGVARVVIGVDRLDAAILVYQRAFGFAAPRRQKDDGFDAEMAWFDGTPIVLAQGLRDDSWVTRRVREYGNAPCAFILAGGGGSKPIVWVDEKRLGWRLGIEGEK